MEKWIAPPLFYVPFLAVFFQRSRCHGDRSHRNRWSAPPSTGLLSCSHGDALGKAGDLPLQLPAAHWE